MCGALRTRADRYRDNDGSDTGSQEAADVQRQGRGINETAKSLKLNGEKVEGWMGAMTMDYKVDDPALLKKLKAGDQIHPEGRRSAYR